MASIRQISNRRKAITNIRRITRTMEMISTAKYKFYKEKLADMIDFYDALAQATYLLVTGREPIDHPLLKENKSGNSAIMAIGSDRGLCGPFNNYLSRLVIEHSDRAKQKGSKLDIYASGSRLVHILNSHHIRLERVYDDIVEMPTDLQLDEICDRFIAKYTAGELDYFGVVYMRYFSATSQRAQTLAVMPLHELIDDLTTRIKVIWPWEYTLEDFYLSPTADQIIEGLAKMIIRFTVLHCFTETVLSEHVARMVAMRSATENANDMIRQLTNDYNKARQTAITSELLDLIGSTGVVGNE